jgi:hypothetical protein
MSELTITTYLCSGMLQGIEKVDTTTKSSGNTITVPEGVQLVEISLLPNDFKNELTYNVYLGTPQFNLRICKTTARLTWYLSQSVVNTKLPNDCTLQFNHPQDCSWLGSKIEGGFHGPIAIVVPDRTPGPIPASKDDMIPGEKFITTTQTQSLVPGERVLLKWAFDIGQGYLPVAFTHFYTCCFTGGIVKSVVNPDTVDVEYEVECEGVLLKKVKPSDFQVYSVGEYVFVAKIEGNCAIAERSEICAGSSLGGTDMTGLLNRINHVRKTVGSGDLIPIEGLASVSRTHADYMVKIDTVTDLSENGDTTIQRVAKACKVEETKVGLEILLAYQGNKNSSTSEVEGYFYNQLVMNSGLLGTGILNVGFGISRNDKTFKYYLTLNTLLAQSANTVADVKYQIVPLNINGIGVE